MRCLSLIVAACLGLLVAPGGAAADTGTPTGTVSGTLRGATVPPKSRGVVVLRALRLDRGTVGGARRVRRNGAYELRLEPGPYALVGTVVDRAATAAMTTRGPDLTLRAGQRRAIAVRLRKPKLKHKHKRPRPSAKAAYVQEDGTETPGVIAYQVLDFTGATGEFAMFNRALPEMLMTDTMGRGGCATAQVAGPRDLAAVAAELDLQRSPNVDPSTRVRRNWILPDVKVKGRLANRPGALAYVITIVDARTGATRSSLSGELKFTTRFFEQVPPLGARIMDRLCHRPAPAQPTPPAPPAPPPAIDPAGLSGTFTGDVDYRSQPLTPLPMRITWNGTLDLARQEYGIAPAVIYALRSGSVTATLDIDGQNGSCDINGTSTIDLLAANFGLPSPVLVVDLSGPAPVYRLTLAAQGASIAAVKSNCTDDPMQNGQPVTWPLSATPLALTVEPQPVASRFAFNETLTGRPTAADPVYHWTWALSGA